MVVEMRDKVLATIEVIRPALQADGGDIELHSVDEATGVVEKISLRTTVLRGLDGTVWHVPNGEVQRVGNMSQLWSVALVDVDVAYDSDLAAARDVILDRTVEVCSREEWADSVIDDPKLLGVEALGADGITIRLTVKTIPGAQWSLQPQYVLFSRVGFLVNNGSILDSQVLHIY